MTIYKDLKSLSLTSNAKCQTGMAGVLGSILTGGTCNVLMNDVFLLSPCKPLMSILPTLFKYEKPRMYVQRRNIHARDIINKKRHFLHQDIYFFFCSLCKIT